jgi:fumarate reductase subunit D
MHRRSNEPLWWAPFGAGMMLDALAIPALALITGILLPFALGVTEHGVFTLFNNLLVRLALWVLISASFFHGAHRMRFTLVDLGLKGAKAALGFILYGAAIIGTVVVLLIALKVI